MNLSEISLWGLAALLPLMALALSLFWLTDRNMMRQVVRVFGTALLELLVAGAYVWMLTKSLHWWTYLLWLIIVSTATAFLALRNARLGYRRWLLPSAVAVILSVGIMSSLLLLSLPARLVVGISGVLISHQFLSLTKMLQTYTSALHHTYEHRQYLIANGASQLEALMPSIRRALRGAVLPQLVRLSSPLAVAMPLLFCGLLLGGATVAASLVITVALWVAAFVSTVATTVLTIWLFSIR